MADCTHAIPVAPFSNAKDAWEVGPDDHGLVLHCASSDIETVRGEVRKARTNPQTAALGICSVSMSTFF